MANLINMVYPLRYPVETVSVEPPATVPSHLPNMVIIGGSFVWKMLTMMGASRQFSEIEFYSYYKVAKHIMYGDQVIWIATPAPSLNFESDIFAADALVLEINEEYIRNQRDLTEFLRDALAVLPDPSAPKASFHYERPRIQGASNQEKGQ